MIEDSSSCSRVHLLPTTLLVIGAPLVGVGGEGLVTEDGSCDSSDSLINIVVRLH